MHHFGFRLLLIVLLPGFMLAASAWLILDRFFDDSRIYHIVYGMLGNEWQFTMLVLLASALLGTISATSFSYIEKYVFDSRRIREFQKSDKAYTKASYEGEWSAYVDSLGEDKNSYVSWMTMMFFFESRTALASVALGMAWASWSRNAGEFVVAALLIVMAYGLYLTSNDSHRILARYRRRNFGRYGKLGLIGVEALRNS